MQLMLVIVVLPLGGHPEVGFGSRQGGQLPVEVILARVHVDEKVALAAVQPLHQSEGRAIVDRRNLKAKKKIYCVICSG